MQNIYIQIVLGVKKSWQKMGKEIILLFYNAYHDYTQIPKFLHQAIHPYLCTIWDSGHVMVIEHVGYLSLLSKTYS